MRDIEPPSLATWMLQHCIPGRSNEALAGDLLEEFRAGRSITWYWRQVLDAIVLGCTREILNHSAMAFFAALWSMLAPAWVLVVINFEKHFNLSQRFLRMDWPWSSVCDLGLLLGANLVFIWAGILLYLIPRLWSMRKLKIRLLNRGIFASLPVLIVLWVALIVLPKYFIGSGVGEINPGPPVSTYAIKSMHPLEVARVPAQQEWVAQYGEKIAVASINPRDAITDVRKSAIALRLPFFLIIICALWGATLPERNSRNGIAR